MEHGSLHIEVRYEGGMYWAQVDEWPGCFASGQTLDELTEAVAEAITLYVTPEAQEPEKIDLQVQEMILKVGAARPLIAAREPSDGPDPVPPRTRDPHAHWPLREFHRR